MSVMCVLFASSRFQSHHIRHKRSLLSVEKSIAFGFYYDPLEIMKARNEYLIFDEKACRRRLLFHPLTIMNPALETPVHIGTKIFCFSKVHAHSLLFPFSAPSYTLQQNTHFFPHLIAAIYR